MGVAALSIATLCYVVTAIALARKKDWALCLTFAAYAVANVGLLAAAFIRK
jgi:hypothetical protein